VKRLIVEPNRYFDSIFLMRIGSELEDLEGIDRAVVAMGTPANLKNLESVGFSTDEAALPIRPTDLVIAVDGISGGAIDAAKNRLEAILVGSAGPDPATASRPTSIRAAIALDPDANLALISVPGEYAAREARRALGVGLHVMLFSDHVTIDDEISLKDEAIERGLLLMGPDCGTAILNGRPLGFANACRLGKIGIVGASGTGIQEISSIIHRLGGGISQAIGTGGRDLSSEVGGRMTRFGIEALARDPGTDVIVVVSKAPAPRVADAVLETLSTTGKPSVVHFVAGEARASSEDVSFASTLADAGRLACAAAGIDLPPSKMGEEVARDAAVEGRVVGLFCGGTLCQEAWSLMTRAGLDVTSNAAGDLATEAGPNAQVEGHALWDLGDDAFTLGKPHPMIEPSLRDEYVAASGGDPSIGIVLVDCVIGYGAHGDPAASLADAARRAICAAGGAGRELAIVASVTGTELDPQNAERQCEALMAAGVIVAESNADAVRTAIRLVSEGGAA